MPTYFKLTVIGIAVATLAGCAVTTDQVQRSATNKSAVIEELVQRQIAAHPVRTEPVKKIRGNYLGQPVATSNGNSLPPTVRDVAMNFGTGSGTLYAVATNIRRTTGIPVRINSDVGLSRTSSASTPSTPVGRMPIGTPGGGMPASAATSGPRAASASDSEQLLPLSFNGDLNDYLNQLASALGITWEYENGEIHFFRRVTRSFTVALSPGALSYRDEVSTSGQGTGSGTGNQQQTGTFGSQSAASTVAQYNPWTAIDAVLKTMVSADGKYAVNQASGTVVVTDSREIVDRIGDWVRQENDILSRQVAVEIREIAVDVTSESQVGVDFNLVFQKLNAASGAQDWVFRFGAPSTLTDASAGSIGFNVARPGSRMSGSNLALQALNTLGNIVSDTTKTVVTFNRVAGSVQDVTDRAILGETTPASGGATGTGGSGVPGLKPGLVTYGDNLIVVPTIGDNNVVMLQVFDATSTLLELNTVATGQGATFQQINTPVTGRRKSALSFRVNQGETLIIVGKATETLNGKDKHSVTGMSSTASVRKTLRVLLVTPRIMQGA